MQIQELESKCFDKSLLFEDLNNYLNCKSDSLSSARIHFWISNRKHLLDPEKFRERIQVLQCGILEVKIDDALDSAEHLKEIKLSDFLHTMREKHIRSEPTEISFFKKDRYPSALSVERALAIPEPPHTATQLEATGILFGEANHQRPKSTFNVKNFLLLSAEIKNRALINSIARSSEQGFSSNLRDDLDDRKYFTSPSRLNPEEELVQYKAHEKEFDKANYEIISQILLDKLPYFTFTPEHVLFQKEKYRLISNKLLSGVNAFILFNEYSDIVLDGISTIQDVLRELNRLHPNEEIVIVCEDVTAFYRQFLVRVADALHQITLTRRGYAVDHKEEFGDSSSPRVTCQVGDTIAHILWYFFRIICLHYVDNFFVLTTRKRFKVERAILQSVMKAIGWPLNPNDSVSGTSIEALGFDIDTKGRTVSVPFEKKKKIIESIQLAFEKGISLGNLDSIKGKLVNVCQVIKLGMCYAWKLWTRINELMKRKSKKHHIVVQREPIIYHALKWFRDVLGTWCGINYYDEYLWRLNSSVGCASDSSPIGASWVSPTHYSYWIWCPCCWSKYEDEIGLFEMLATLMGLSTSIGQELTKFLILWLTDSAESTRAFNNGYGNLPVKTEAIAEMRMVAIQFQFEMRLAWTGRQHLAATDLLTRGSNRKFLESRDKRVFRRPRSGKTLRVLQEGDSDHDVPYMVGLQEFHSENSQ